MKINLNAFSKTFSPRGKNKRNGKSYAPGRRGSASALAPVSEDTMNTSGTSNDDQHTATDITVATAAEAAAAGGNVKNDNPTMTIGTPPQPATNVHTEADSNTKTYTQAEMDTTVNKAVSSVKKEHDVKLEKHDRALDDLAKQMDAMMLSPQRQVSNQNYEYIPHLVWRDNALRFCSRCKHSSSGRCYLHPIDNPRYPEIDVSDNRLAHLQLDLPPHLRYDFGVQRQTQQE